MTNDNKQILIGKITSPHGIRGLVKVTLFIDDVDVIAGITDFNDSKGNKLFEVESLVKHKTMFLVKLKDIDDRNQSESIKGTKLYLNRDILPEMDEDEFLLSDLKDLSVKTLKDEEFGKVVNVFNYPAGDVLEIVKNSGEYFMITFTKKAVPTVDIEKGFIIIDENLAISNKGDIRCTK